MGPYFMQASSKFPRAQKGERYDLDFPARRAIYQIFYLCYPVHAQRRNRRGKGKEINIQTWSAFLINAANFSCAIFLEEPHSRVRFCFYF
jgi:hypothetical protein